VGGAVGSAVTVGVVVAALLVFDDEHAPTPTTAAATATAVSAVLKL
jgi:hypothetical protein